MHRFVRQVSSVVLVTLGVVSALACGDPDIDEDDNQFREDVIVCEEAVARLAKCCPGFEGARVLCNYYYRHDSGGGCGTSSTDSVHPALSPPESACVLDKSCEALVESGVCDRAQEATTYTSREVEDSSPVLQSHPPVCP